MTMFIDGGVLSTGLQTSLLQWWSVGKMLFGPQGEFSLQYREGPLGKIGSTAAVSTSYRPNRAMASTCGEIQNLAGLPYLVTVAKLGLDKSLLEGGA